MNLTSKTDKAWLAGFIDGEGYIGLIRNRKRVTSQNSATFMYHPWVVLTSTDPEIMKYIQHVILAQKLVVLRRTAVGNWKQAFQVKVTKFDEVTSVLNAVLPYLRIKNKQANLVIDFCRIRKSAKIITGRGNRGFSSFGEAEDMIYLELRKLNKRGIK